LVAVAAWEPFDVTLELGTVASKIHALRQDVWQAGALTDEGIAIVHYALFGLATCLWLQAVRSRRVALWGATIGVTAAVGLEGAQVAITSRMPGLEDAVVRAAGALAGGALWPLTRAYPARKFWLALLIAGVAAGAAIQQLSPFEIAPAYHPFGLMPFFSDYAHTTFESLSHVFELVLLYAPLGFVWRHLAGSGRPGSLVGGLAVTLAIAWPIEYFQGWIVGRYPDLTDIAMSLVGCWAGIRAADASSQPVR
jgi:VanZ family protein